MIELPREVVKVCHGIDGSHRCGNHIQSQRLLSFCTLVTVDLKSF